MVIAKWTLFRKEFSIFNMNGILFNWKTWMACWLRKERKLIHWSPPNGALKFNVDGTTAIGKQRPPFVGEVLCNHKGEILLMFSKHEGSKESNEAEVVAMLEAL